jgi:ribonuclease P protein component
MKKINRLLKNKDFKNVLDKKNSVASKEYIIYKNMNQQDHIRVGISVSSKIGNSVVRHKIKRQINEMLRILLDISANIDLVIIVRNNYTKNSFYENKEILERLLKKLSREGK